MKWISINYSLELFRTVMHIITIMSDQNIHVTADQSIKSLWCILENFELHSLTHLEGQKYVIHFFLFSEFLYDAN